MKITPHTDPFAKCPLVLLEWLDSHANEGGWTLIRENDQPLALDPIRTVGWIIRENRQWLEIAQNIGGGCEGHSPQFCNVMTIPKRTIISRRVLTSGT